MVIDLQNVARAEAFFQGMGLRVVTRSQYLGGFIGDQGVEATWLDDNVEGWVALVRNFLGVDHQHPQTVYTGLHKSLQKQWAFVQ